MGSDRSDESRDVLRMKPIVTDPTKNFCLHFVRTWCLEPAPARPKTSEISFCCRSTQERNWDACVECFSLFPDCRQAINVEGTRIRQPFLVVAAVRSRRVVRGDAEPVSFDDWLVETDVFRALKEAWSTWPRRIAQHLRFQICPPPLKIGSDGVQGNQDDCFLPVCQA